VFSSLALVLRDPLLRLILAGLFLVGVAVSSVMPFASLVGIERFGLADATYSSILFVASLVTVSASIVIGIVSDQRANRAEGNDGHDDQWLCIGLQRDCHQRIDQEQCEQSTYDQVVLHFLHCLA